MWDIQHDVWPETLQKSKVIKKIQKCAIVLDLGRKMAKKKRKKKKTIVMQEFWFLKNILNNIFCNALEIRLIYNLWFS